MNQNSIYYRNDWADSPGYDCLSVRANGLWRAPYDTPITAAPASAMPPRASYGFTLPVTPANAMPPRTVYAPIPPTVPTKVMPPRALYAPTPPVAPAGSPCPMMPRMPRRAEHLHGAMHPQEPACAYPSSHPGGLYANAKFYGAEYPNGFYGDVDSMRPACCHSPVDSDDL